MVQSLPWAISLVIMYSPVQLLRVVMIEDWQVGPQMKVRGNGSSEVRQEANIEVSRASEFDRSSR